MAKWFRTLMNDAKVKNLPVLFVRFEDLVANPEPQLREIMMFLNNMTDLTGTNAERRVKEVIAKGKDATVVYNLKENTRSAAPSNHKRYTKEQLAFIQEEMKDILYYFGYAKNESDTDQFTAFFEYADADPELVKTYNGYKELNKQSLEWNAGMTDEERAKIWFMNSDPAKSCEVIDFDEGALLHRPLRHDISMKLFGEAPFHVE